MPVRWKMGEGLPRHLLRGDRPLGRFLLKAPPRSLAPSSLPTAQCAPAAPPPLQ